MIVYRSINDITKCSENGLQNVHPLLCKEIMLFLESPDGNCLNLLVLFVIIGLLKSNTHSTLIEWPNGAVIFEQLNSDQWPNKII